MISFKLYSDISMAFSFICPIFITNVFYGLFSASTFWLESTVKLYSGIKYRKIRSEALSSSQLSHWFVYDCPVAVNKHYSVTNIVTCNNWWIRHILCVSNLNSILRSRITSYWDAFYIHLMAADDESKNNPFRQLYTKLDGKLRQVEQRTEQKVSRN